MNEELKVIIKAEVDKFKKGVEDSKKQIKSFKDQVKDASGDCDANFKKIGSSISTGVKSAVKGAMAGVTALGVALVGSVSATEEYRTAIGKLNTAFESAGSNAEVAKNTYNDLYRVLGDSDVAVEASNHLAKLTTNEKELSEWTNICQGVYATFGDSLPIEGLTEASNETAKVGQVTGSLADALNWAGVSEDKFNESLAKCNSESQREKLIRETLSKLYDDASSKYEKNNKGLLAQREAQAKLQESLAKVGEAMQPVITAFTEFANNALEKITPLIQGFAEKYLPKIQEMLSAIGVGLQNAFNFVSQYYPILIGIATVIGTITTAIGLYNTVSAIKTAMDTAQVTTVGALISAYLAQAAAMIVAIAPYIAITAAIVGVIAVIVLMIKNWDKVKKTVVDVAKKIWDALKNVFNWIKSNWQGLLLLIVNPFAGAFKLAYDNCEGFRNKVNSFVERVKSTISNGFSALKDRIVTPIKNAVSSVKGVLDNLIQGFKNKLNQAKNIVKNAINNIKQAFNVKLSIPKIKIPTVSITGKFSLSPPQAPKFKIHWNALGGVFDKPTLFSHGGSLQGLGEQGAEAVVPLQKNTQWMNVLAKKMSALMTNNQPIILQVDGKTFAQISVDSINALTKQTGRLGLNLV